MFETKKNYVVVNVKTKNFYEIEFDNEDFIELAIQGDYDKPLRHIKFNPVKDVNVATRFDFFEGVRLFNDALRVNSMSNIEFSTANLKDLNGDMRIKSNDYKLKYLILVELEEKESGWEIKPFYESYFL